MKTLYLPLKKEWYEMIESGRKTEEYREIKPYWEKRLLRYDEIERDLDDLIMAKFMGDKVNVCARYSRGYTRVCFSYGYTKRTMTFECKGITIGKGNPAFGAPENEEVFIIKHGERL